MLSASTSGAYTNDAIYEKNAGSYSKELVLNSNYQWSSGSNVTSNRMKTCSLNKATPTIILSTTSLTTNPNVTEKFTATVKSGASAAVVFGYLNTTSGIPSIATVSPNGNSSIVNANYTSGIVTTIRVTGVKKGSSTITIKFTPLDTDNFNDAVIKTCAVTVSN